MARNTVLKADEETLNLLRTAATIGDQGVTLGSMLTRPEYDKLNKFFKVAGAKWDKKSKMHLYTSPDTKEKLEALLEDGELTDDKKKFQAYYTPENVSRELISLANIQTGERILEPSAGEGALAEATRDAGADVFCVELNPVAFKVLDEKGFAALNADFLDFKWTGEKFDKVVMNPPFTNDQDIQHINHALKFLKPGGELWAIMWPGFRQGDNKVRTAFRKLVEETGEIIKELPEGTFKESGTNVRTVIVKLVKS